MPAAIDWTTELETAVLSQIESGDTLRVTASKHSISAAAIIRHVQANEEFAKQYARVIDCRTDQDFAALEDELNETPQTVVTKFGEMVDAGWVAWKRLQIDTRKWSLAKRNPKKYGERIQQEVTGELGIKTILLPATQKALDKPKAGPEFEIE